MLVAAILLFGFGAAAGLAQQATMAADDSGPAKHSLKHRSAKTAKAKSSKSAKAQASRSASKKSKESTADAGAAPEASAKPVQLASFGDWGAFLAQGDKDKTCYALAQPKERKPENLKRDPAYIFVSSRPGENIHNEVSIMMGFPMKDGGDARADVDGASFELISKGSDAWIKNPAQEPEFIKTLKKSSQLVVKATSTKGHTTTDSYSLAGLSEALQRVDAECSGVQTSQ